MKFRRAINALCNCRCCNKRTHSSIDGNVGIELCRRCYDSASEYNIHQDGGCTPETCIFHNNEIDCECQLEKQ